MEDDIYNVKKTKITRIEDDSLYQKYSQDMAKDVPEDDLKVLIRLFFNKAAVNMGKDAYDAPDATIEAITEFVNKDYKYLPVMYIGMAVIRGSLGRMSSGRLVPGTIYRWLNEISVEYHKVKQEEKYRSYNSENLQSFDLHKYPVGKAICKKIDWLTSGAIDADDWDKIPLKEVAERIGQDIDSSPEMWGVTTKNK